MKGLQRIVYTGMATGMAAVMAMSMPIAAFAQQSPDYAYSPDQWAGYRDNNLTYDEIAVLVHEYNPDVLQNADDYTDYIGKDSTDVARTYYDAAEEIYANMQYPDSESSNYAQGLSSYINSQISYESMIEQGDNNTNDAETIKLGYDKEEANLVKQAQELMVTYWTQYYNMDTLRAKVTSAENDLNSTTLKVKAGTATESQRLTAEQTLSSAKASLSSAESSLESTRESLILMLGWQYGADVNIGAVPEVTDDMINAIDLQSDIVKAKENNYSLKSTIKQLSNARSASVKKELTATKATSEDNIAKNVSSLYDSLKLAQSNLSQAQEALSIQQQTKAAADRKLAAGTMTQNSYNSISTSLTQAEYGVTSGKLSLLKAWIEYQAAVNGLANT